MSQPNSDQPVHPLVELLRHIVSVTHFHTAEQKDRVDELVESLHQEASEFADDVQEAPTEVKDDTTK